MAVGQARFGGSGGDLTLCSRCCPHTLRNSVTTTPWPRTDALAWHLSGGGNFVHHVDDDDVLSECVFVNRSTSLSRKKWTNARVRKTRSWKRGNALDKWLQPPRSIDEKVKIKAPPAKWKKWRHYLVVDSIHTMVANVVEQCVLLPAVHTPTVTTANQYSNSIMIPNAVDCLDSQLWECCRYQLSATVCQ